MAIERVFRTRRTRSTLPTFRILQPAVSLPLLLLLAAATCSWFTLPRPTALFTAFLPPFPKPVAKGKAFSLVSMQTNPTSLNTNTAIKPAIVFHENERDEIFQRNETILQFTSPMRNLETLTAMQQGCHGIAAGNLAVDEEESKLQGPYHNWKLFSVDFQEMLRNFKIFVYPDAFSASSTFSRVFLPHQNPFDPKLGNYFSEHMFKISLLRSSFLTSKPEDAHFFFMPFSINALRNDPRVRSEPSIAGFVAEYTTNISREFEFWNASRGFDHFYVCCHSVGRDSASKHRELHTNAVQVSCSSSYFQRFYMTHKDVGLPQVWPRAPEEALNSPDARTRLVFFAGRAQNSLVRQELMSTWGNDTSMDIFSGRPPFTYEEGFRRSRFCLHVKGYEVNTARISDSMHYGCIPVIVSDLYDLPFANVLDWSKFSILASHGDIRLLKAILMSVSQKMYKRMYENLCQVRKHFRWHMTPRGYDSFHMTAYQLWLRRGMRVYS